MAKKNRKGVNYPPRYMKQMKKIKKRKLRRTPIDKVIIEKGLNDAERVL